MVRSRESRESVSSTTRSAEASHSAKRIAFSTSQLSAIWAWAKAVEICTSSPTLNSPARAANRPQDADEGNGREKRVHEAENEVNQRLRRQADIVRDTVLRIAPLAADDIELVEAPIGEPARDEVARDPLSPAQLQAHS